MYVSAALPASLIKPVWRCLLCLLWLPHMLLMTENTYFIPMLLLRTQCSLTFVRGCCPVLYLMGGRDIHFASTPLLHVGLYSPPPDA